MYERTEIQTNTHVGLHYTYTDIDLQRQVVDYPWLGLLPETLINVIRRDEITGRRLRAAMLLRCEFRPLMSSRPTLNVIINTDELPM